VYLDQSIHGEWLGKSALRWTAWKVRKQAAIASNKNSTRRLPTNLRRDKWDVDAEESVMTCNLE
jgi:hypothetical protein